MRKAKSALLYAWQLPQNLLGYALMKMLGAKKQAVNANGRTIAWHLFAWNRNRLARFISGVSLGRYILLPYIDAVTVMHEHGHSRQSAMLGPAYLLIVGIPSALGNLHARRLRAKGTDGYKVTKWYYSQPWEAWADRLGGVKRPWH